MLSDDQVKAVVELKKHFVVSTGWRINCENEDIKQRLENSLRDIGDYAAMDGTFDDALSDILSAYEYGFSLTEPVYTLNDDNEYVFKSLRTRPPHTFRFDIDPKGNVISITQSTDRGDLKFRPDLFLHHVYQMKFGNPYGLSDLNAAHNAWKAKKFVERFMAVYVEKFASPLVVGRYKTGMTEGEIAQYLNVLETVQNNTNLVIPEDATLDIIQSSRDSSDAYIKALDYYNMRIARAMLVPDLMGLGGAQSGSHGGSLALGQQQFDVFLGVIRNDRESLAAKITNKLINPTVKINYGDNVEAWFEFVPFTEDDVIEHSRLWAETVKAKVYTPNPEEIEHFRETVGYPQGPVEIPEPVLPQAPGMPGEGKAAGNPGQKLDQEPGEDPGDDDVRENTRLVCFRRLTEYEKKVDFKMVKKVLDTGEMSAISSLEVAGRRIYKDFVQQIKDKGIITKFHPEKMNDLKPRFQREMNVLFRRYFVSLFRDSQQQARLEIFPNGTKNFSNELLPEDFMRILDAESFKITGDYSMEVTKRMKNVLDEGLKAGASQSDITAKLMELAKDQTSKWLNTVVRTKSTEIYNTARRLYWETDPLASQIVEAYQFSAILDDRTSEVCAELDGKVFEKGDDIDRITPAMHMNCRSILIGITKFENYSPVDVPSLDSLKDLGANLKAFEIRRK